MSEVKVNKISPRSGTALTVGDGGDTVTVTGNDIRSDAYKASDGGNLVSQSGTTITLGASGDTVEIASGASLVGGGISWQSSIVTAATHTAASGEGYWIDTTSNACTITLPAAPAVGDQIIFTDYARKWGTNAVTINQNSKKFQGATTPNPVYDTAGQSVDIVYSGATQGWIPNSDDDVTFETNPAYDAEYLLVAGGGAGGSGDGAGAGAGGHLTNFGGTAIGLTPGAVYTVTVGGGGAATGSPGTKLKGADGDNSTVSGTGVSLTAIGGGGGGASIGAPGYNGGDGGSGGGGGNSGGTGGSGTVGQGNDGGDNGAGGGAGAVGTTPNGGAGLSNSITGSAVTRAGGGGRFVAPGSSSGPGGSGGGTSGSPSPSARSSAGTANTGGGSGGGDNGGSGTGGSGVVILSMADADYSGTTTGSPTVATGVSGKTVLTFNASGSYTA